MKRFDAHFHIIDSNYPLVANNGYLPPSFTVKNYQKSVEDLNVVGGAIVSGSFQKFDQTYLIDSLSVLGTNYFGVANIPFSMSDTELNVLDKSNIRAVRFNLKRGGSEGLKHMVDLSNKVFDAYGWHTELYVDSKNLKDLKSKLVQLPKFSIDHLGLSKSGLEEMYYWADKGVKIKATGFGRLDFNPVTAMKKICSINPHALMFGTDLPSTRAKEPFSRGHLYKIEEHFSTEMLNKILYSNAKNWYDSGKTSIPF